MLECLVRRVGVVLGTGCPFWGSGILLGVYRILERRTAPTLWAVAKLALLAPGNLRIGRRVQTRLAPVYI